MDWIAMLLIVSNALTLAWALKLLGRQPNRRLRYLILTVSIVSISQTVAFLCHLEGQSLIQAATVLQQCVTSMGTMAAVYLLWVEIRDRNRTDQMLRLAEYDYQVRQSRVLRQTPVSGRTADAGLEHFQDQALQIMRFGNSWKDGVVRGLGAPIEKT